MTKWWFFLILSAVWLAAGVVNVIDGASRASIIYDFSAAAMMAVLGLCRFFLQKKGEKGLRAMKIIYMLAIAALVIFVTIIVFKY